MVTGTWLVQVTTADLLQYPPAGRAGRQSGGIAGGGDVEAAQRPNRDTLDVAAGHLRPRADVLEDLIYWLSSGVHHFVVVSACDALSRERCSLGACFRPVKHGPTGHSSLVHVVDAF